MVKRLGNVLYWLGCGIAVVWLVVCVVAIIYDTSINVVMFTTLALIISILIWLIGRACRYVLSGN